MFTESRKQTIKLVVAISIICLILITVGILMIKYEVEGETNMPFKLSKIIVVGTVEGVEKNESKKKWDFSIYQNNDIHFYIDQNKENTQDLLIKSIKVENINVIEEPQKGTIKVYMPNSEEGRLFSYDEQFEVKEKLEYKGASQSSSTNLTIGSKGGTALIRISNTDIGNYTSDKDKQIEHNASLLEKIETSKETYLYKINVPENTKLVFYSNITFFENNNQTLPLGMDISQEGLINMDKYKLELKGKDEFNINIFKNEFDNFVKNVKVYEYNLTSK